ncbi:TPA: hypothetical protein ACIPUI_000904 [Citrobacter freundii]
MKKAMDKRLIALQRLIQSKKEDELSFPPLSGDQNDPAWVAQAEAWTMKHMGKTFAQAMQEAEEWADAHFPDLD